MTLAVLCPGQGGQHPALLDFVDRFPDSVRVVEAATGRRGSIDAGTHKPDLAIVDLALPDVDGIEVIRHIREWSPMPIIVLSARAQEQSKIDALDAGANDYVTKPFGIGELLAGVGRLWA